MKLYSYWRSSASWRVRIALHHKGLPFSYEPVQIVEKQQLRDEYRSKNPMQQVPLLELEDEGKTLFLAQSLPILEYLEERFPAPPLLPRSRAARARVRQLAEIINAGIQPFQNLPILGYIKDELGADAQAFARRFNARGLEALEQLAAESAGTFLVGDQPSFADLCLIPQLYSARRFKVDVETFPTLVRVEAACAALPAFVAAHPDAQPDAPKS